MEDASPIGPDRLLSEPRRLTPVPARRWAGFPAAQPLPIGRGREIATLRDLVLEPRRRLLTLTGPGGVGKTRLALAVAEAVDDEFADGAAFVELAEIRDAALLFPTISRVLGLRESPDRTPRDTVISALRDTHLLLVLDNLEHLVCPGVVDDLAALLTRCPRLSLLVTSRVALHLHDERLFSASPLALPPADAPADPHALLDYGAVALFVERARLVQQSFTLTPANARAIVEICRRLDGLPLAIELAAAWVRVLPPAALLARLEPRLPLLQQRGANRPRRLRTMQDAVAWSYDLLTGEEQRFFRALAIFSGGFTLAAAASLWSACSAGMGQPSPQEGPGSALDLLARLVDRSLVQLEPADGVETRFTMLETLREFARDRLAEHGEEPTIAAAHAAHMLSFAEHAEEQLLGPDDRAWYVRCNAELGNIRSALAWSVANDVVIALRMSAALWVYWSVNLLSEGRSWLNAALANAANQCDLVRARAYCTDAALACMQGDFALSERTARHAAALAESAGDPLCEARARWVVACNGYAIGQTDGTVSESDRSIALFAHTASPGARTHAAYARAVRGGLAFQQGEAAEGIGHYEMAVAQLRETGCTGVTIVVLTDFAAWLITAGETARARRLFEEALSLAVEHFEPLFMAFALFGLAAVPALDGDGELAARRLGAVDALSTRIAVVLPAPWQARVAQVTAMAREAVGDNRFSAAWQAGRAEPDRVIAAALNPRALTPPTAASSPAPRAHRDTSRGLSPRERQILSYLVAGRSDREIAAALFISRRTVSSHVGSILRKLDVGTRGEAAVQAVLQELA